MLLWGKFLSTTNDHNLHSAAQGFLFDNKVANACGPQVLTKLNCTDIIFFCFHDNLYPDEANLSMFLRAD